MTRRPFLAAAVAVVFGAGTLAEASGANLRPSQGSSMDQTCSRVRTVAEKAVRDGETPGLAVSVVRRGETICTAGYGISNLELGTPVTPDSVFNIFSVTKPLTAAAVLQLREQGRLSLEDPLSTYVPEFPRASEVTLRQLLGHTSGIRDYADTHPDLAKLGASADELLRLIARQPALYGFEPGTHYAYSNSNYVLLGKVIEKASGLDYRTYMQTRVFAVAEAGRAAVDDSREIVPGRVSGYVRRSSGLGFENHYFDISVPYAAGAVRSTTSDLARLFTALFAGRIISAESLAEMTSPARVRDGRRAGDVLASGRPPGSEGYYGLGIRSYVLDGHRAIGPGGSWAHFSAKVSRYPDQDTMIVVLANTGGAAAAIEQRLAKAILPAAPISRHSG